MQGLRQEDLAEKYVIAVTAILVRLRMVGVFPASKQLLKLQMHCRLQLINSLKENYADPQKIYLKEIAERIEKYSMDRRIVACEALLHYIDSLEKFNQQ